ncbi:hypothetical protein EUGRSUZ_B01840 [Eucalyptus grandis]|uniref:Uncharacterized protein n=2 Tax=Eucalyptus grandis TaxID=71139 RepID=A0ACC3LSW1_EUCGR|nr:hypothetical protein EUGRSUZ_B01840 [Eucalyptus grandis]
MQSFNFWNCVGGFCGNEHVNAWSGLFLQPFFNFCLCRSLKEVGGFEMMDALKMHDECGRGEADGNERV